MFEPLIQMYERGGGFGLDGTGCIEVDMVAMPRHGMQRYLSTEPRAPLTTEELDALDSQ
ncbi:coproporphyrinogen III oxidase [Nocardiopsis mwathae]|uniref:Coproporphyrinogen III oxidase n=1 Tax=Nocardiopsis mwathae TaxID=1472723 RepID=A0A7X0D7Z3_9ACTN|nr:coproporphyrinogen III oxidase [Nocardiopsis mwathae]